MIPDLIGILILIDYLYGNARWSFVSEFYETTPSLFLIKPLITVLRHPRARHFAVTAKGEIAGQDFISPLVRPLYWLVGLTLAGMLAGLVRVALVPGSLTRVRSSTSSAACSFCAASLRPGAAVFSSDLLSGASGSGL